MSHSLSTKSHEWRDTHIFFFDPTLIFTTSNEELKTRYEAVGREIDALAQCVKKLTVCAQLKEAEETVPEYTISEEVNFEPLNYWSNSGNRKGFLRGIHKNALNVWSIIRQNEADHEVIWLRSGPHPATILAFPVAELSDASTVFFIGSDFKRNTMHRTKEYSFTRRFAERTLASIVDKSIDQIVRRADCTLVHPGHLEQRYSHAKRLETTIISTVWDEEVVTKSSWEPDEPFDILFVGRLTKDKGIDILIESLQELVQRQGYNVRLTIRGTGGDEEELRKQIRAYDLDSHVTFVPFLAFDDLLELFDSSDIFVLPSRLEGQGRVLIEALASGCAVVGSRTGGIPEIIKHEETGLLFESGNVSDLTSKLSHLLEEKEFASEIVNNGVKWAEQHTLETETERTLNKVLDGLI